MSDPSLVLVSGAGSYVGLHVVDALLRAGFSVRGSVRDTARAPELTRALDKRGAPTAKLSFVSLDLLSDAGWQEAATGARFAIHVASPFPSRMPDTDDELVRPAVDGTLRMLRAAQHAKVERVVLTSSCAAISSGHAARAQPFSEQDWSDVERSDRYSRSKTLAERAAWKWHTEQAADARPALGAINPPFILGPLIDARESSSLGWVTKLLTREMPLIPNLEVQLVDVRDVAAAHVAALTAPEAAGERFCVAGTSLPLSAIARILKEPMRARGRRIPQLRMPDVMFKLVARFDPQVRAVVHLLGHTIRYDSARAQRVLGFTPRPVETTVVETAHSLLDHKLV
jgi:dihydroflavonol-4-reductase